MFKWRIDQILKVNGIISEVSIFWQVFLFFVMLTYICIRIIRSIFFAWKIRENAQKRHYFNVFDHLRFCLFICELCNKIWGNHFKRNNKNCFKIDIHKLIHCRKSSVNFKSSTIFKTKYLGTFKISWWLIKRYLIRSWFKPFFKHLLDTQGSGLFGQWQIWSTCLKKKVFRGRLLTRTSSVGSPWTTSPVLEIMNPKKEEN